jgi:hypothetical protein
MTDDVTLHAGYLTLALALLWFRRQWMRSGARVLKRRNKPDGAMEALAGVGARDPSDKSVQPGREFTTFRNYLDLFRALAGSYCLAEFSLRAQSDAAGRIVLGLQAAILLVGVALQAVRLDGGRLNFFAPIFYLLGMSVGFCHHYTGLFAFALVLAINPIIPNPRIFLTAFAFLLLSFGVVFGVEFKALLITAGLILAIPLASLLTKRPVVIFSRKAKSGSSTSSA